MLFNDFHKQLRTFELFSILDVKKIYPKFDSRRLNEWQHKNYITKLINGWYRFNDIPISETTLFQISNYLRSPSYVSLETALSFYNVIPEQTFSITAVTTVKTKTYHTAKGTFIYKTITPKMYFGYTVLPQLKGRPVLMAELEKALLDLLYLNATLNSNEAIKALRLNMLELQNLNEEKIDKYLMLFDNKALTSRYSLFKRNM